MRLLASGCVVLVVLVAACSGGDDDGDLVSENQAPGLVLREKDVPSPLTLFDRGEQSRIDQVPGPREDAGRFGRRGGWKARYRRGGTPTTRGPLIVESRLDLYPNAEGAEKDLDAYRKQFEEAVDRGGEAIELLDEVPRVGDETYALSTFQENGASDVQHYSVAWRDANVTASITVVGFAGRIRLADAVALARRQQARIEAAAG